MISITLTDQDAQDYLAWRRRTKKQVEDDALDRQINPPRVDDGRRPVVSIAPGTTPADMWPQQQQPIDMAKLTELIGPPAPPVRALTPKEMEAQAEAQERAEHAARARVPVSSAAGPALPFIEREDYRAWCQDAATKLGGGAPTDAAVALIKAIHGNRTIDQLSPAEFQGCRIQVERLMTERGIVAQSAGLAPGL